jgi:hypothetical protein
MRRAPRFLGFILVTTAALAQPAQRDVATPVPSYEIARAATPVVIDGKLDDPAWTAAREITLQFPWQTQTGAKQKTSAKMLWNDEMLFVAFTCEDEDIVAHHEQRDDPTYKDDAVEIFIQPNPKHAIYVGLEMNARAVLYDYVNVPGQMLLKAYDLKGVLLASSLHGTLNVTADQDKGWTLEVAIPLRNFLEFTNNQPVAAGTTWTANLNRWDGTEPHRRLSMWSDSGMVRPNPHNPKRCGQIVFVK